MNVPYQWMRFLTLYLPSRPTDLLNPITQAVLSANHSPENMVFKEALQGSGFPHLQRSIEQLFLEPEWTRAIDSEAMRARGINCFRKIHLVGQKYQDKTTLAS